MCYTYYFRNNIIIILFQKYTLKIAHKLIIKLCFVIILQFFFLKILFYLKKIAIGHTEYICGPHLISGLGTIALLCPLYAVCGFRFFSVQALTIFRFYYKTVHDNSNTTRIADLNLKTNSSTRITVWRPVGSG